MRQQDACSHLADVGTLAAHVWPRNDLHVALIGYHAAIVTNARGRILHLNQGVATLNKLELFGLVHLRSHVAIIAGNLSEGSEHVQL
mmetsp:Transcript_5733/g.7735  ORF Transcript_5733/g.7735 Transcript_5733/m.7735 type:complete len:87 (+) Transcript_5733:621-881(+)